MAEQRVVALTGDEHRLHQPGVQGTRGAELDALSSLHKAGEVHVLHPILDSAGATSPCAPTVLARADRGAVVRRWSTDEREVLELEGKRPGRAQHLQQAIAIAGVVSEDGVAEVVSIRVSKVLGLLPIEAVRVVDAGVVDKHDIVECICSNEHVVPVELVLDHVRGPDTVVLACGRELTATLHVRDHAVGAAFQIARHLVVQVQTKALIVVVDITFEGAERSVLWAHAESGHALALLVCTTWRPDTILVSRDAILDQVVRHSDHVDARTSVALVEPVDRAHLEPGADDHVGPNRVQHLVSVLYVDPGSAPVPDDVVLDARPMRAMNRDADLLRVHNRIALEDTVCAMPAVVEVQAVATHLVALAAVFHAGVAHVHDTPPAHDRVDPLLLCMELIVVASDDNTALEINNLRGHLETPASNLAVAAPVIFLNGLLQVQHCGKRHVRRRAVDLYFVHPEPCVGRLPEAQLVRLIHGRIVCLDADGTRVPPDQHIPKAVATAVSHIHHFAPKGIPLRLHLNGVHRRVPAEVEIDPHLRHVALTVQTNYEPVLFASALRPAAEAAPRWPAIAAVDGSGGRLPRVLVTSLCAEDGDRHLGGGADGCDAVRSGAVAGRSCKPYAVSNPPTHRSRAVLDEELLLTRLRCLGKQRPRPTQLAATNVDPGIFAQGAKETVAQDRVTVAVLWHLGDVDCRLPFHGLRSRTQLENTSLLHQQVGGAKDEAATRGVPLQLPADSERVYGHVLIYVPRLGRRDDHMAGGHVLPQKLAP
mmetsp:Transcript_67423/g.173608  ORF Transcript_67423/g.173608 Transcript_67423/m.173608 type:complete len:764 (+) Transcript_67423:706-2997(+)